MILMSGLFAEKRLFIFRWGRDRKSKTEWLERILSDKITDISEDHYLLFHNIWDKEEGLSSWLRSHADIRVIDTLWDKFIWTSRSGLDAQTVWLIIDTYRQWESSREKWDTNALLGYDIAHTMERVSLMIESSIVLSRADIVWCCDAYGWDTVFALGDAIMDIRIPLALDICRRLTSISRVDAWIGSFIWLLRNNLYIRYLRECGQRESEIASIIRIHPYVLKKWYNSRISYTSLRELYEKIITSNIAYKRGKWLKDTELWRILSIELALLDLQKTKNL